MSRNMNVPYEHTNISVCKDCSTSIYDGLKESVILKGKHGRCDTFNDEREDHRSALFTIDVVAKIVIDKWKLTNDSRRKVIREIESEFGAFK